MTQPLNYTPKAIEALLSHADSPTCPPGIRAGMRYIAGKLREAVVFQLSDHGQLLDRSKPRPEVPGHLFRPPFPVVALEYPGATTDWGLGVYDAAKCSRRIALAWEWSSDLPTELRSWTQPSLSDGVVIASVAYFDAQQTWFPIGIAMHLPYDGEWIEKPKTAFQSAMVKAGRMSPKVAQSRSLGGAPIGLLPEGIVESFRTYGSMDIVNDALMADLMDEASAYLDLCYALACKNVAPRKYAAPKNLNRNRIKAGKIPLKDFYVLELAGGEGAGMPGSGGGASPRSHLRRGHIRRLDPRRITWVNSTIVRGRGFVDKVYSI